MAKIIDSTGKGSAITAAEHDANFSTLAGKNQSITTTTHTIDVDDQGEVLEYSNASAIAVTLPTIASVSGSNIHTDDFSVTIKNIGAGLVTVTRGGTDTFEGGATSITVQRGEQVTIMTDSTLAIWNFLSEKNQIHYYGGASSAGTDTYAATLPRPPAAYETGRKYYFKADVANTGACTINFNSIAAVDIKLQDGSDPYTNAIIADMMVELMYDGTNMVLLNPEHRPDPYLTQAEDSNGNEVVIFGETASAVNEVTVTNAATGNKPAVTQTGADDVGIDVEGVELHNGRITDTYGEVNGVVTGTATISSVASGNAGISSAIAHGFGNVAVDVVANVSPGNNTAISWKCISYAHWGGVVYKTTVADLHDGAFSVNNPTTANGEIQFTVYNASGATRTFTINYTVRPRQ